MTPKLQKYPEKVNHKAKGLSRELAGGLALPQKQISLATWAARYMEEEVFGIQAHNTAEAKKRDLTAFMEWYYEATGHLLIEEWLPRDTQEFLGALETSGRAPTTINRTLATLRRFAKWAHEQKNTPFVAGLPTRGIKELDTDEPEAKKLSQREINRLFRAADKLIATDKRKNARPRRNRAILALLYYTGLRVSEMCRLTLEQYNGEELINVKRKGRSRSRKIYLSTVCQRYIDDYLENERKLDDPKGIREWLVIAPSSDGKIGRSTVRRALEKMAREASAHTKDDLKIHPHRLRHTFGFEVRKHTGSDTETAALLGHAGLKYVGRYVRNTEEERKAVLEKL